ncbi:protein kinase [Saccharomycopsis crataegensis]|uniref:Protein-serine/threonine kinase n=1 Tax=Saccharomycopsis crataegensis TaxID=43959 RepID=A0AAV5QRP0_9ASCO|nr:protein kinase [Saccharomycopsis crataegensis]
MLRHTIKPHKLLPTSNILAVNNHRGYTSYKQITSLPLDVDHNTTDHNYIKYLAQNFPELGPYPTYSKYVNPLHFYQNTVMNQWSSKKAHPITLQQLANFGKKLSKEKVLSSANFVRLEIAIRIAKKLKDFQILPFAAISNHHLVRVYESYYNIFESFRKIKPITNLEENEEFCKTLSRMLHDNLLSLPHLIMGSLECRILNSMTQKNLDEFMSATLRARVSRRLICEEHLSLTDKFKNSSKNIDMDDCIGDIFYKCSAIENLQFCASRITDTYKEVEFLEKDFLLPELIIQGNDVKFPFMVTHLRYIFGEILRNSYDSTINNFIYNNGDKPRDFFLKNRPPPIKVTIINAKNSIEFRFSDQGGGLKGMPIDKIWSFGKNERIARESLSNFHKIPGLQLAGDYSPMNFDSSDPAVEKELEDEVPHLNIDPDVVDHSANKGGHEFVKANIPNTLQNLIERPSNFKLNLGLAMCKVYAEYWNGNIVMNSLENYGTDTHLSLSKLEMSNRLQLDKA